jgi:hypothetical protein
MLSYRLNPGEHKVTRTGADRAHEQVRTGTEVYPAGVVSCLRGIKAFGRKCDEFWIRRFSVLGQVQGAVEFHGRPLR